MTKHQKRLSIYKAYREWDPWQETMLGMYIFVFAFLFAFITYAYNLFNLGNTVYGFMPMLVSGLIMLDSARRD